MATIIRPVTNDSELRQIQDFRYRIWVDELSYHPRLADHVRRTLMEPLDESGCVIGAWDGQHVVGTVRTNMLRTSDIGDFYALYRIDRLPSDSIPHISVTTSMAVAPQFRRSTLFVRLATHVFHYLLDNHISTDLIDCRNEELFVLFSRLGYVLSLPKVHRPGYGKVDVMRLDVRDKARLEEIRSPLRHSYSRGEPILPTRL